MEFDRLPHFVALAENLHFGRTSELLGLDQAQLSRSIRRLEDKLGVPLFDRTHRQVTLTPAGEAFYADAKDMMAAARRSTLRARRVHSGEIGEIRLSYATPATYRLIPKALRRFGKAWPDVRVRLMEVPAADRVAAVAVGEVDASIILRIRDDRSNLQSLAVESVEKLEFRLAAPESWPIAQRDSIRLAELKDLPFVMFYADGAPKIHDNIMTEMAKAGLVPQVVQYAWAPHIVLGMVAEEIGVALSVHTASHFGIKGVKLLPIEDLGRATNYELLAIWNANSAPPALAALMECISQAGQEISDSEGIA